MTLLTAQRPVTEWTAAEPAEASAHFESLLRFETDCWDCTRR